MAPALSVLESNLVAYRNTWRGSAISSFILPILFVIGFGVSVGGYVDAGGRLGSTRYLDYIVPGMIASTTIQVAFGEMAWPVMSKFRWLRTYHAMAATPLRVGDIIVGDALFLIFRVLTTAGVFLAVTTAFGAVHSAWAVLVLPICGLLSLAVAAPIAAVSSSVETDGYMPLIQRFAVIPMTLFAGVFFPIGALPFWARCLAYVSPLWHGVELCRAATLPQFGISPLAALGHLCYLVLWCVAGYAVCARSFRRRLVR
jgi:lipooligosaccharide transport system permease protein